MIPSSRCSYRRRSPLSQQVARGQTVMFTKDLHLSFLKDLSEGETSDAYMMMEHIRINGIYWALTALCTLGYGPWTDGFEGKSPLTRQQIIDFVASCKHPSGGYGGNVGLDPHMLFTLSAVQILTIIDAADQLDVTSIVKYIKGMQLEDGSFAGDEFGEIDTRFSYCAVAALSLLGRLSDINEEKCAEFITNCRNFDGGYGVTPGCESHAGQSTLHDYRQCITRCTIVFCCVAALHILGQMNLVRSREVGEWLALRQLPNGGLNGRPEKLEDVCYSWWVLSALHLVNPSLDWISKSGLTEFILRCQDPVTGGISDRPGDMPDVFHTLFGIAGLSLMRSEELEPIDPAYCMPSKVLQRLHLI